MKRYCICPITLGTPGGGPSQGNRAAITDLVAVQGVSAIIPTDLAGAPKYRFAFCVFSSDNLAAVLAVTNLYCLPDYPLDGRMDGMEDEARTGLVQSVAAYDMTGAGLHFNATHDDADSFRAVLTKIGQQFEPAFALNNFDVRES